jgi:transmembrane sensor
MNQRQQEEQIRDLLARYIKGECTEHEVFLLETWYERISGEEVVQLLSPADEERLVRELCKAMVVKEGETNKTEEPEAGEEEPEASRGRLLSMRRRRVLRHVAVWAGLIVVGCGAWLQWNRHRSGLSMNKAVAFIEISTGYQQVRKVILPDSSVVWLNSATHLSYHPDFTHHREIRLSGEAFFDVADDKKNPFIVKAGQAFTQVLGTSFNISAYPEAGQLRIALKSGRIRVGYGSGSKEPVKLLNPGELLIYDKEAHANEIVRQAPGEMDVWTTGTLLFYQTPLKEALAQIEARYGVHFVYDHPLRTQRTVTARFENTALEKVLAGLSFGWDLRFTRSRDTVHVFKKS